VPIDDVDSLDWDIHVAAYKARGVQCRQVIEALTVLGCEWLQEEGVSVPYPRQVADVLGTIHAHLSSPACSLHPEDKATFLRSTFKAAGLWVSVTHEIHALAPTQPSLEAVGKEYEEIFKAIERWGGWERSRRLWWNFFDGSF
jgi:hypothetical protein